MNKFFYKVLLFILAGSATLACEQKPKPMTDEELSYFQKITTHRDNKDMWFRTAEKSPLLPKEKAHFEKLNYFPISPAHRYILALEVFEKPDTITMMTTRGLERKALRYGKFDFEVSGKPQMLYAFKFLDLPQKEKTLLFLPFLDQSAGEETYGGGRYIDLHENETGVYDLDFNFAYNPHCAYGNKAYSCPLPPTENTLSAKMPAGEKRWH